MQVWLSVHDRSVMYVIPPIMDVVVSHLISFYKGRFVVSVISRLIIAVTTYYIWQERNNRLFKNKSRSAAQLVEVIVSTFRLKLGSFRFQKVSPRARRLIDTC